MIINKNSDFVLKEEKKQGFTENRKVLFLQADQIERSKIIHVHIML